MEGLDCVVSRFVNHERPHEAASACSRKKITTTKNIFKEREESVGGCTVLYCMPFGVTNTPHAIFFSSCSHPFGPRRPCRKPESQMGWLFNQNRTSGWAHVGASNAASFLSAKVWQIRMVSDGRCLFCRRVHSSDNGGGIESGSTAASSWSSSTSVNCTMGWEIEAVGAGGD